MSDFSITVDGRPVPVVAGQSIAAAVWADGGVVLRRTRGRAAPRGMFCGIGVCFDCLVTLNGRAGVRSCLVAAAEGDVVEAG